MHHRQLGWIQILKANVGNGTGNLNVACAFGFFFEGDLSDHAQTLKKTTSKKETAEKLVRWALSFEMK